VCAFKGTEAAHTVLSDDIISPTSSQGQTSTTAVPESDMKSAAVNESTQMPNLDSFATKLNNFAVVLSEKARSRPLVVGNVADIESALDIKKVSIDSVILLNILFRLLTYMK